MLAMLRDLVAHKGHANARLLTAVAQSSDAATSVELCELLHHVLVSNRFWALTVASLPFDVAVETQSSRSLPALIDGFRATQELETRWVGSASDADVDRVLEGPFIPGGRCTVGQALMQVCLHSQGHRAQCATLLRRHGVAPPATDFILWLVDRRPAEWPEARPRPQPGRAM